MFDSIFKLETTASYLKSGFETFTKYIGEFFKIASFSVLVIVIGILIIKFFLEKLPDKLMVSLAFTNDLFKLPLESKYLE